MGKAKSAGAQQGVAAGAFNEGPAVAATSTVQTLVPVSQTAGHGRDGMIAVAAYYRAERRGFAPGHELEDWLAAAAEITNLPASGDVAMSQQIARQDRGACTPRGSQART